jgi:myo-inositol 2-dehydrogenase/D-chiro-inositol 1-dehydrogenase
MNLSVEQWAGSEVELDELSVGAGVLAILTGGGAQTVAHNGPTIPDRLTLHLWVTGCASPRSRSSGRGPSEARLTTCWRTASPSSWSPQLQAHTCRAGRFSRSMPHTSLYCRSQATYLRAAHRLVGRSGQTCILTRNRNAQINQRMARINHGENRDARGPSALVDHKVDGVVGSPVAVVVELHGAARGVEGHPGHREHRLRAFDLKMPSFQGAGHAGADALLGDDWPYAAVAQDSIEPAGFEILTGQFTEVRWQPIGHQGEWGLACAPHAGDVQEWSAGRVVKGRCRPLVGADFMGENGRERLPAVPQEAVVKTCQLELSVHLAVGNNGAEPSAAYQESLVRRAREAVLSGELGFLHTVRANTHDQSPPPADYLPTSGGLFRDCSVHDFDVIRFVTNQEVASVFAVGANKGDPFFAEKGDIDTGVAVLTLDDGTLVLLSATRYNGAGHDVRMEVMGSAGTIGVGYDDSLAVCSAEAGVDYPCGPQKWSFMERFRQAYVAELTAFCDLVSGRTPSLCTVSDALEAFRIAEACERSRVSGRPVALSEIGEVA